MGQTRPLGILVFDVNGSLLRYSKEAHELTGYPFEQVETQEQWCQNLFPDPVSLGIVQGIFREMGTLSGAQASRSFEFVLPFRTASGDLKDGQFSIALTGQSQESPEPLFLVSLMEKVPAVDVVAHSESRDLLGQALSVLQNASGNLLSILDESQRRVIASTNRIRGDQVAMSHQWDGLFQEAFALARIRDLVTVIRDSTGIAQDASRAQVRQADPDRPLVGVPVGKPVALPLGLSLHKLERFWILSTLQALQGNRSDCARHLDIALRTVRNKLGEYKQAGFKIPSASRGRRVKARIVV